MKPFQNADLSFAKEPPNFLDEYFTEDKRPVSEVAGEGLNISADKFINYGMEVSLVESGLGFCTNLHRDTVYDKGFGHPSALTLARLASRLVDAPKSGLCLRPDKWEATAKQLAARIPEYIKPIGERRTNSAHIMDELVLKTIPDFQERVLRSFHELVRGETIIPIDADIKAYYETIRATNPRMVESLKVSLLSLKREWTYLIGKKEQERNRNNESVTCSPTKKMKRSASSIERSRMVLIILFKLMLERFVCRI